MLENISFATVFLTYRMQVQSILEQRTPLDILNAVDE